MRFADRSMANPAAGTARSFLNRYGRLAVLAPLLVRPVGADTGPDPFSFAPVNNATVSKYYDSKPATLGGIDAPLPISIVGGLYKINEGPYTGQAGTVSVNDRVSVLVQASNRSARSVSATLSVGNVSAPFTVTTGGAIDTVPDPLSFTAVDNAQPGETYVSAPAIVAGITRRTPISVTGGRYRINAGSFSSVAGTVGAGDQVHVEVIAANLAGTAMTATITIGGVSGSFTVTTAATADTRR